MFSSQIVNYFSIPVDKRKCADFERVEVPGNDSMEDSLEINQNDAQAKNNFEPVAASLEGLVINSVQGKPELWGPEHTKKFPAQTWELWEKVCREVGVPVTQRSLIKNMWLDLRKRFKGARERALKRKPSGGAANTQKKSRFNYYDQMMFCAETFDVPE